MIPYTNHNSRLSSIIRTAVIQKLDTPFYQMAYRQINQEFKTYSTGGNGLFFKAGRAKLQDKFPSCGFEAKGRQDPWGALSSTKDIEVRFDIYVAIEAIGRTKNPDGLIDQTENYIIALAEYILEVLNEINTLQYTITTDEDGKPLDQPISIYDSYADGIDYGFLYNGALRIARIDFWTKTWRTGSPAYLE